MYWLYGIDTVLRIAIALAAFFVAVPMLAWRRPASFTRMDWFWWNAGAAITLLTLAGQLFTLLKIASAVTYVALAAFIVAICRARHAGASLREWTADAYRRSVIFTLHLLDDRRSMYLRVREAIRSMHQRMRTAISANRAAFWSWIVIITAAAITRLYRPLASANLGFSDTYVHLYLMRLLDEGRQVDPAWGPYPRGMHFLLLPIERLTNVEPVLLINFFGAFSGILLVMAVAWAAQRITESNTAAVLAGLLFATMIGGASQYFALGGSVSSRSAADARALLARPYEAMLDAGEFDVLLTAFQRQASTLPQELAIVLLFPAALFLLDWLRTRDRWRLSGFVGCTAAIAATHSGVVVPLVALCAAAALAALLTRTTNLSTIVRGALAGAAGVALGSSWMLGFLRYRSIGGLQTVSADSRVGATALYYFPFLRSLSGSGPGDDVAYMMLTPLLAASLVAAAALIAIAIWRRAPHTAWIAAGTTIFVIAHAASTLGIPEIIEVRRNASWLAPAVAVLVAVVAYWLALLLPRRIRLAVPAVVLALWAATVPNLSGDAIRPRLIEYSGYGGTTWALVRVAQNFEPFTWTFVSYGQEYPMVLGRGFHLNAIDFLERYDPEATPVPLPTPHVFIAVEKTPHRFQVNSWSTRFDRAALEERLQTWCDIYGLTHRDLRVYLEDENVRVYRIDRAAASTGDQR